MWEVYILKCADGSFYTGITMDLKRRVDEHNHSDLGARYTKTRRPVKLVYSKRMKKRSLAMKEEIRIKRMSKQGKIKLID